MASTETGLVRLEGDGQARGRALGEALGERIRAFVLARPAAWRVPEEPRAAETLPLLAQHAPHTLAELRGLAETAGLPLADLVDFALDYDRFMLRVAVPAAKCTGFAACGAATADGTLVCGQNNDEGTEWAEAGLDVVLHHVEAESGLETLLYTHAGLPAYMGMNSAGLCVLWFFINNRDVGGQGVPTVVLIREVLRRRTLDAAIGYLRETPRLCPNAFLLGHARDGVCSVECSHTRFVATRSATALCHANHILSEELAGDDASRMQPENGTFARQRRMETLVAAHWGRIDAAAGCAFLRNRDDGRPSILAQPANGKGGQTLASMVFRPASGEMRIAFGPSDEATFQRFAFSAAGAGAGAPPV